MDEGPGMTIRIEVRSRTNHHGQALVNSAAALGILTLTGCEIARLYFLDSDVAQEAVAQLCDRLLADPVMDVATWQAMAREPSTVPGDESRLANAWLVEVAYRPGVTDVAARELQRGMVEIGLPRCNVATATRYELQGELTPQQVRQLARQLLCNETVQHYSLGPITPAFTQDAPPSDQVETLPLTGLGEEALQALSRSRLLALDLHEMRAIQEYYLEVGREPTDVELETLAQTWSEHCVHKTFRAQIGFTWRDANGKIRRSEQIDGLLKQYIRAATEQLQPEWLRSAFVDNAGIIAFDGEYDLAFKVETHNHPSALEPFGGANTGVGGVVRDILGVSARPIATTDVLCFGPQDFPHEALPPGVLHPQRIADGVVAGIGDYGNKLGLPTVNGAILYDAGYLGNPLVFCGCVGLLPHGRHPRAVGAGDLIVALGGRTGRDGIHGATFSSAELTHETSELAGSAVQIGDPITEKGLIELVEAARDEGLYTAITDCGAGGFSSAVGEMGAEQGVEVELTNAPLKYSGLLPWEIWLSEAQERLVMAVPPEKLGRLQELADLWEVEISTLGHFTGEGQLRVRHGGRLVADLPMAFLHEGLPRRQLEALWQTPPLPPGPPPKDVADAGAMLLQMLAHPNVASKERVIRRYDHEVRGGTLVRPLVGPQLDGPADAAVLKPLGTWGHNQAFALSVGINPLIGKRDPYAMAVSAVDEAFRNAVAVGADPDRIAILDNFCWGNPRYPDRLGALVRACQGCYDAALAYRAPFISGKDSLNNEFNGQPIPGTLLISAIGIVPEMERCVTSPLKQPGNLLYLLGETLPELGGSLLYTLLGFEGGHPPGLPPNPLDRYRLLHSAIRQGWIQACHDLSEGGLAVALAEMCIGGRLGATINIGHWQLDTERQTDTEILFSERNGRLLIEIAPEDARVVEAHFLGQRLVLLGTVSAEPRLVVNFDATSLIDLTVAELVRAWKGEFA
jgi:phosphoribosylformylglycinamidine synthase subunit PurSL